MNHRQMKSEPEQKEIQQERCDAANRNHHENNLDEVFQVAPWTHWNRGKFQRRSMVRLERHNHYSSDVPQYNRSVLILIVILFAFDFVAKPISSRYPFPHAQTVAGDAYIRFSLGRPRPGSL